MERRRSKRMFCLGAVLSALALAAAGVAYAASSSGSTGLASGDLLIKDTATSIAPGVTEHEVVTNNSSGNDQKIDYLCEVDLKGTSTTKIVAGYGADYSADSWGLTSTTAQAAGYEAKTGETVVAGINADFFNMATGEPMGALVMDGDVKHGANGRNFFAILKDGSAVIRDANGSLDDVQAAVGGDMLLIKDGQIPTDVATTEYGNLQYSRTAIGIKADGTVVTFATHGRLYPVSCGRTYQEIAEMLKGAGCVSALALDGGGSSTYIARPEGTSGLELRNSPSDGAEREVSSSLLIVSTAKATGEFDHAVLTPNNEVYTPSSTITFEAAGADSSGKSCALPDGLTWKVASDSQSLGTIDAATGEFAASGKEGLLTVELMQGDKSVGQTTVDIAAPDQIYFASEEISLGFEAESDLGLVVRSKARDVHYNVGDIVWSSTNDEMGHFEGNTFISSDGKTLNGDVTATSKFNKDVKGTIHVVVGLLPTTVWDFEDQVDESGNTVSAEDYYTGENGILTHSNYGRGGKESIEIASSDNDEPVRFGNKSLKLNYDFTQCGEVTEGACIGTTQSMTVPGTPTGIGVWVYAPEGTGVTYEGDGSQAGFWLRGYVRDAAGNNMPYDFTLEPKACKDENGNWNGTQPGISWTGWKYLEADMTKLSAPLSIQPGMTFRLMFVNGTKMGTRTAGSIYFDNLQFVYGANVDDVDAPVVNSVSANGTALEDGAVLNTNNVTFDAVLSDVENKYTSGVDVSTVRLNIDGVNTNGNDKFQFVPDPDGSQCHLYNVVLSNGEHSVTVSLRDKFGNETSVTKHFTVKGEGIAGVPTVTVVPKQSAAILGVRWTCR